MLAGGALRVTRVENCASAQEIDENAPVGAPNLVRIRDFQVFRDFGVHGLTLVRQQLFPQHVTLHET